MRSACGHEKTKPDCLPNLQGHISRDVPPARMMALPSSVTAQQYPELRIIQVLGDGLQESDHFERNHKRKLSKENVQRAR